MAFAFHRQFLTLVEALERDYPVADWRCGDVEVWPLARMDLYLDLFWSESKLAPPKRRAAALRALGRLATPLRNVWKSRRDLEHWVLRPRAAHAIFLGDGLSLDLIDGAWQDRFCEPLIVELERSGLSSFLMQGAELARLPWRRPTFSANVLAAWGEWMAPFAPPVHLREHAALMAALKAYGVQAPSLALPALQRRAQIAHATADAFEWVLRAVRPTLAFVVTFYAGLGAPFLVACRRRRVLSIDLQHCPQEGAHKAYGWSQVPAGGYAALPAVFWTWTQRDAEFIGRWAAKLDRPWHSSLHGGHTQLAGFTGDAASADPWSAIVGQQGAAEREILVALQPVGAGCTTWQALRRQIEAAPRTWRWWIRRHPGGTAAQDREFEALLSLRLPNVMIEDAARMPLPLLLRHMHALVSFASGAAAEAAALGVPAYFLSEEAAAPFDALIARGEARIVAVDRLLSELRQPWPATPAPRWQAAPLAESLHRLTRMAESYARW